MAEAILKRLAGDYFEVYSAGFKPSRIYPQTYTVIEEWGGTLKGQTSKALNNYLGKIHFGIVITVCSKAEKKCPTMPGVGTRLHWPIPDPIKTQATEEDVLNAFRFARDKLIENIKSFLDIRKIPYSL